MSTTTVHLDEAELVAIVEDYRDAEFGNMADAYKFAHYLIGRIKERGPLIIRYEDSERQRIKITRGQRGEVGYELSCAFIPGQELETRQDLLDWKQWFHATYLADHSLENQLADSIEKETHR